MKVFCASSVWWSIQSRGVYSAGRIYTSGSIGCSEKRLLHWVPETPCPVRVLFALMEFLVEVEKNNGHLSYLNWLEWLRLTEVEAPGLVFEHSECFWSRVCRGPDLEALDLDDLVEGEREDELLVTVGLEEGGAVLETVLQRVIIINIETLTAGHVQVGVEGHRRHDHKPAWFWRRKLDNSHHDQRKRDNAVVKKREHLNLQKFACW